MSHLMPLIPIRRFAHLSLWIVLIACFQPVPSLAAQHKVEWNHEECGADAAAAECNPVLQVTAEHGEVITLTIKNTCPTAFSYTVVAIPRAPESSLEGAVDCDEPHPVQINHDRRYGGYVVHVVKKVDEEVPRRNARITISVTTSEWNTSFSGGFTVNNLVDNGYALREITVTNPAGSPILTSTKYQIVEQEDRGDAVGRSVASFAHLSHTRFPSLGLTFGIGVDANRTGEYYFGPSFLFGERGALTAGVVIGNVASLPSGRRLNDTVSDANTLSNLGDRQVARAFIGLSFRFLGGGADNLKKPFLGGTTEEGSGGAVVTSRPAPLKDQAGGGGTASTFTVTGSGQPVAPGDKETLTVTVKNASGTPAKDQLVTLPDLSTKIPNATAVFLPASGAGGVTPENGIVRAEIKIPQGATAGEVELTVKVCSTSAPPTCAPEQRVKLTIGTAP
jgi:hypothetical protein